MRKRDEQELTDGCDGIDERVDLLELVELLGPRVKMASQVIEIVLQMRLGLCHLILFLFGRHQFAAQSRHLA